MRRFLLLVALTLSTFPAIAANAATKDVPLSSVARSAHLSFAWLPGANAVQLSGPGIVMVFRPGDSLYEVNDGVESSSVAPRYAAAFNDLYVSSALAARISGLARNARQRLSYVQNAQRTAAMQNIASLTELRGAISMNVEQLKGAEAVLVTGEAPPSAPVLITLLGLISSEVPNVVVGRHDLQAGPDGKFQAIVPIGPDYVRGSFLKVLATSGPGVSSASAQIQIVPANAGLVVPYEQMPGGIW
ncbi:MAG TPA: hypothetical protein VJP76_03065 [Candidatus Tumulicola sp.]|nr:hypothetical protein [Candidatus Tumulicola sp.]